MADHFEDFPFEEIRTLTGDYFATIQHAQEAGYELSQIWSVTNSEDTWTFGPSRHFVNLIGYVATEEHHDDETYYHEIVEMHEEEYA